MIQDPQLEQLFRMESGERLANLDRGLLDLEKTPDDQDLLENLFRETHSLKGAARMLGLSRVEEIAHGMESQLNAARRADHPLTAEGIDTLNAELGKLRQEIDRILSPPAVAPTPPMEAPPPPTPRPAPPEPAAGKPFQIETVRMETEKLDDLLTLTGELGILRSRSLHRQALMAQVLDQWAQVERGRRGEDEAFDRLGELLRTARDNLQEDAARFDSTLSGLQERIQSARLLPLATVFNLFPRMVRDLARDQGKQIELVLEGADITLDKRILEEVKDPLMHLLRNAVDHGIEPPAERTGRGKPPAGTIRLSAARSGPSVTLIIRDDGRGLDLEAIRRTAREQGVADGDALAAMTPEQLHRLVFTPGFSTASRVTELSGRGVGLDVVSANIEGLKGTVGLDSLPGRSTTVTLKLPISLTTLRVSLMRAAGRSFGLPLESIQTLRRLSRDAFYTLEGRATVDIDSQPLLAPALARLLELPEKVPDPAGTVACAVIQAEDRRLGLQVDEILGEEEVLPRPLGPPLKRVRNVLGLATLASGEICPILNPADLLRSAARLAAGPIRMAPPPAEDKPGAAILLVEDSALVRAMEKRIIEDAGYEVVTAVDGLDGLEKLGSRAFAGVVSDIQMPHLDGLGLTARIRKEPRYRDLPIILVSALDSEEDRRRGLEVGASAYLPKPTFDQRALADILKRLIGP
jgi:two-component system chemotaxis sensor kinase CheA